VSTLLQELEDLVKRAEASVASHIKHAIESERVRIFGDVEARLANATQEVKDAWEKVKTVI